MRDIPVNTNGTSQRARTDRASELLGRYNLDQYVTDWHEAWNAQPAEVQWLYKPLLERGTANVIYSDAGIGKSLITLELAASIAKTEPVLYLDCENRTAEHVERLTRMGYEPETLANVIMLSFPMMPSLDSPDGGELLTAYARRLNAALVIIDTTMRLVDGHENDNDTFNDLARHTILPLKSAGICTLRLDHEGKDAARGQRGSSGKRADVDTVWRLTYFPTAGNRYLDCEKSRSGHHPAKIRLEVQNTPYLHHVYHWVKSDAEILDNLGLPPGAGRNTVRAALAKADIQWGTDRIAEAIRMRKKVTSDKSQGHLAELT
jgi:hypothetical protein